MLARLLLSFLSFFICKTLAISNSTVFELIASNNDLTMFQTLLEAVPEIKRGIAGEYTVFAPTNAAISAFVDTRPDDYTYLMLDHAALFDAIGCNK
jgi:hypothetical protein